MSVLAPATVEDRLGEAVLTRARVRERHATKVQLFKTPKELHDWITRITGHRIPRTAVCEDHDAPFDVVWDFYSHDVSDALLMGNRGGGKTENLAALHLANGYSKPGFETSHIGAIDIQGKRCYAYYRKGLRHDDLRHEAPEPHIRETIWRNGSWIEILPGTEAQTQGGHPMFVTYDELESGKFQPYENAKAMSAEWENGDGLHVGQNDLRVEDCRLVLDDRQLVGTSNALLSEAEESQRTGADYLAVGAIFTTSTKTDTRPAGLDTLRAVRESCSIHVVAIGGINASNLVSVMEAGANSICIATAITMAADIGAATSELVDLFETANS